MAIAVAIAVGGSLGALARYAVMELVERRTVTVFPWDTLTVNVTGCFLAAFLVAGLVDRVEAPSWLRLGLIVGFLGAYTTFSTFAQDLYDLAAGQEYAEAVANVFSSLVLGVLAVLLGTMAGRGI
jgi:CrcB protein